MPAADFRLRWAPAARKDLRAIWHYYARIASPSIADKLLRKITGAAAKAAERPFLRPPRDTIRPGLRAVVVHPYTLFYRLLDREVEIVRILYERRDFRAVFQRMTNEGTE
jgi:toxin ParE1/3/4